MALDMILTDEKGRQFIPIVYNQRHGGFGLSDEAKARYLEFHDNIQQDRIDRSDPVLVRVVRELGSKANSRGANLTIGFVEVGQLWRISEYDGMEEIEIFDPKQWQQARI